jgi:Right handed beta helix region
MRYFMSSRAKRTVEMRGACRRIGVATAAFAVVLAMALATGSSAVGSASQVTWPSWAQLLLKDVESLAVLADTNESAWQRLPLIPSSRLGIIGDGRTDVTGKLQMAVDSLAGGGTLLLESGVYVQSRCLELSHRRVRIVGKGARLHAVNPDDMCISLEGAETELRGLELTARTIRRGVGTQQARIVVRGRGARVIDNRIYGATSAGIWVQGAHEFAIIGNAIAGTMADGIHHSEGAADGYIAGNVTDRTGDDGIAVVSYRSSERCRRVLIEDNRVSNVSWARGIAVVGSADVVVRRNEVVGTGRAAGIIVTREESYDTFGVDRVIVADNRVSEVARRFDWPRWRMTGQASIDLNAHVSPTAELRVERVLISGNRISDGGTDGIRLVGGICRVNITDNAIERMDGSAIRMAEITCPEPRFICSANHVDASADIPPVCREP